MIKAIPYGHQWITAADIKEAVKVLRSDWITQGPVIREFEEGLCQYTGAQFAVTVSSGTAALHLASLAAGLGKDEEVITSPITFVASANCALYCGARPVFADIQEKTANIDPEEIEKRITKKTKTIIPVHYAGHPCDMGEIWRIAKKHKLMVIEDAAHALGAKYKGFPIGSGKYSDMTTLSFHPVKHITTGEGGAVLTNSKNLYEKLLLLRNHGITKERLINRYEGDWYYEMRLLGYNYRLTDFQSALGLAQIKKLDLFIRRRREIVAIYNREFKDNPYFDLPVEEKYAYSSYHLYAVRLKNPAAAARKAKFSELRREGIGVQVHYIPVYYHPFYQRLGYKKGLCRRAEEFYKCELSLPLYPLMTNRDVRYVVNKVNKVFSGE